jgi:superfamily II DNA or RNA helicase
MSRLRPFQARVKQGVYGHWQAGRKCVLGVIPTGGGKSVVNGSVISEYQGASASIAHRSELVSQLALALARENVRHRIIGPTSLVKTCTAVQMAELGRSMTDPGARVAVAGVDTLVKRDTSHDSWYRAVGLWSIDEAHHVQHANKWGTAVEMFPSAFGLGWSATPGRADGGGLGSKEQGGSGVFDAMVVGPTPRELINAGYLTDYRIFAPPSDVVYDDVPVTASGDYSPAKLRAAVHASDRIVGDVVKHYLRIAPGKRGITFAVDVEAAQEIARAFRAAGVPAEVVSAKTDDISRARILREFKAGKVLQLVNVDLFGEGFDVPACEVVSMVRKTESFSLYCQQFGRALRVMVAPELAAVWGDFTDEQRRAHIAASTKSKALIIDHVGNVIRHGLPDAPREWSLADRERRSKGANDAIPLRTCLNPNANGMGEGCYSAYPRYLKTCPYCGFYPEPPERTSPQAVDGDLFELDAATLAALRGEVDRIMGAPIVPSHLPPLAVAGLQKQWAHRQAAIGHLRNALALWSGWKRHQGHSDSEAYRIFYHTYGVDVLSAQSYNAKDAEALHARINAELQKHGVIAA